MIEIHLNGQPHTFPDGLKISEMLDELDLTRKRVAVERNGEIVPKSAHAQTALAAGDRVEIVQAIGGG